MRAKKISQQNYQKELDKSIFIFKETKHKNQLEIYFSKIKTGLNFASAYQSETTKMTNSSKSKKWVNPEDMYGELFQAVQLGGVFPDSKTFVDCVPKQSPDAVLKKYVAQKSVEGFSIKKFVSENFDLPKQFAAGFKSDANRTVDEHINHLWKILTRQPEDQQNNGTLIPLPHKYVVPGGRFGEMYYWDSYFAMEGLAAVKQTDLIENMVDNFSYLIDTIGFIPNGNRTYFLGRSHPPFFSSMVGLLADEKGEFILKKYLPALEKEYAFWMDGAEHLTKNATHRRVVNLGDDAILNRYWDDQPVPRPESYREDLETLEESGLTEEDCYRNIRAACESGWDFTSRWLRDASNLHTIRTIEIIPPDLNSLLFHLEKSLATAYEIADNKEQASFFSKKMNTRKANIQKYCWDETAGFYKDYDFIKKEFTSVPSLAGVFPLYFKIATPEQAKRVANVIVKDFLKPGGVVSTLNTSGEQWDSPNGWAPLQWITIQGFRNYGFDELANTIKNRWIELNKKVYRNTGKMVEKYNVLDMTLEAGGGEYPVQDGFGWTNGILLKLMLED